MSQSSSSHTIFHSNGKLLISGEYFVLDGAVALALPTQPGQQLRIETPVGDPETIDWQSYDDQQNLWFEGQFNRIDGKPIHSSDDATAQRLQQILMAACQFNADFLSSSQHLNLSTHLDFPRAWGLGTSSTLISNIARWAGVDAYQLLAATFGGSGYDIACAQADGPLTYRLNDGQPIVEAVNFSPPFTEHLYFIYLGHKQNSREGIAHYRQATHRKEWIEQISELTYNMVSCSNLADFEQMIIRHEQIVADCIQLPKAKELYFSDYWGAVKSLGAWGGDFVLVTSEASPEQTQKYFNEKGFEVFLSYQQLIRSSNL